MEEELKMEDSTLKTFSVFICEDKAVQGEILSKYYGRGVTAASLFSLAMRSDVMKALDEIMDEDNG